jgi:hypothetical protein
MSGNNLAMLRGGVVEDPLYEVIAILITRDVDQRDTCTVTTALTNSVQVTAEKFRTSNLETLLDNLGSELIGAVLGSITNDMVNSPTTVRRSTVFTDVLNAPVTELAMGHNVNIGKNLLDTRTLLKLVSIVTLPQNNSTYLILFKTVLKNVLHDKAPSLSKGYFMPHPAQRLVDILHDLRGRLSPAELKKLLPNMAGVAMNDCLWNSSQQFGNHDSLEVFRHRVKGFLNNMATKRIHREIQGVAPNSFGDVDNLVRCAMLEASLYQEVAKPIDHQGVGLCYDSIHDLKLLFRGSDLKLLLQEDRGLLIVVADDLVDNVLPVAVDIAIQETAIVQWLSWGKVCLILGRQDISRIQSPVSVYASWWTNVTLPSRTGSELGSVR